MASTATTCGHESDSPWYAVFSDPCPTPKIVTSTKQINIGRQVQSYTVQTIIYEPHPASLWLDWMKTHRLIIYISLAVVLVAVCSYLQAGHTQRRKASKLKLLNQSYYEASASTQSQEARRYEEEESRRNEGGGCLRRHLVQLDERKQAEEKRLFGINLTDISTDNLNRDDVERHSDLHAPQEEEQRKIDRTSKELVPSSRPANNPSPGPQASALPTTRRQPGKTLTGADDKTSFHDCTHLQRESSFSSESSFSKRSTAVSNETDAQSQSSFTSQTNVTSKTSFTGRSRAVSFRRLSVGDVMSDW